MAMSDISRFVDFTQAMARKLQENSHKKDWRKTMDLPCMLKCLKHEVGELEEAIENREPFSVTLDMDTINEAADRCTADEAADVANFAMMIYDFVMGVQDGPECTPE